MSCKIAYVSFGLEVEKAEIVVVMCGGCNEGV